MNNKKENRKVQFVNYALKRNVTIGHTLYKNNKGLYEFHQYYYNMNDEPITKYIKYFNEYESCVDYFNNQYNRILEKKYILIEKPSDMYKCIPSVGETNKRTEPLIIEVNNYELDDDGDDNDNEYKKGKRKCVAFDNKGNIIDFFNSQKEASVKLNVPRSSVSSCCRGVMENVKDKNGNIYIFKYFEDVNILTK